MKKIEFEVAPAKGRSDSVIRIGADLYHEIARISTPTRQPMTAIANRLLAEAIKHVELVETPLYDMNILEEVAR